MKHIFHPEAEEELFSAIEYYEACQLGVGRRFSSEVEETVRRICRAPEHYGKLEGNFRHCLLKNFPYLLIYEVNRGAVCIAAVMHSARHPDYWKHRL